MKNATIFHGTDGKPSHDWFRWLGSKLKEEGYKVWIPELPGADKPNVRKYNEFLVKNYKFNKDTVIVGHSSGAVSILGLLNKLPKTKRIDKAILVAGFKDDLGQKHFSTSTAGDKYKKFPFLLDLLSD